MASPLTAAAKADAAGLLPPPPASTPAMPPPVALRRSGGPPAAATAAPASPAPEPAPAPPAPAAAAMTREAVRAVVLLTLTTLFVFADQNLMAPNLTAIARDFHFSDAERDQKLGGNVAVAFFVLGAPVALLTDMLHRTRLFVAVVLLGEAPCLATAYVTTYRQLLLCRALTGISVGGCVPLLYSLHGDLVPPRRRAAVAAGVAVAQGAGIALGQVFAGYVGSVSGWRAPFVLVALPAMGLAAAVAAVVEEPRRGGLDGGGGGGAAAEYEERLEWSKAKAMLRVRTNQLCFAQGLPGCVPWGVINTFFTDYLAEDLGMGTRAATTVVVVFGAGCVVGNVLGGVGGQAAYNAAPSNLAVLMAATTAAGALPLLAVVNAVPHPPPGAPGGGGGGGGGLWLAAFCGGALASVTGSNVRAVLIGVNPPEARGTAFAVFSLFDSLGKGLGPAAVAALIARRGRRAAFNASLCLWFAAAALLAAVAATLEGDERRMVAGVEAARGRAAGRAARAQAAAAAAAAEAGAQGGEGGRGGEGGQEGGGEEEEAGGGDSAPLLPLRGAAAAVP